MEHCVLDATTQRDSHRQNDRDCNGDGEEGTPLPKGLRG